MVVPALFLLFLIISWLLNKQLRNIGEFKKIATSICALILGITLAWSPWLIRSYLLYGKPCFFNTSETFAFFWDLRGAIRLNDGKIIPISSIRKIKDPKNDYEFSKYGDSLIRQRLKDNHSYYYKLYWERMGVSAFENWITLTKVSRSILFSDFLNGLLIDKSPPLIILGVIGMLTLAALFPNYLCVLPIITMAPWLSSLMFGKQPRYLEPSLPIILFSITRIILLINV